MNALASSRSDAPPACPAGVAATAEFCADEWAIDMDVDAWTPVLERRERAMRGLRSAGDPRAADALGWLTLSGVLTAMPRALVRQMCATVDPVGLAVAAATAEDDIGPIAARDDTLFRHYEVTESVRVVDAGSRAGWAIAQLAGSAARDDVVVVNGSPVTNGVIRRSLRHRIARHLSGAGGRS